MRENKYRFYCSDCKCWHYITLGELCESKAKDFRICHLNNFNASGFQEYINRKDLEDREIYEGDIVTIECYFEEKIPSEVGIIKFGKSETCYVGNEYNYEEPFLGWYIEGQELWSKYLVEGDLIVLGNTYENSELLEVN